MLLLMHFPAVRLPRLQLYASEVLNSVKFAVAQRCGSDLAACRSNSKSSLCLKEVALPMATVPIVCGMSTGTPRPFVPPTILLHSFRFSACIGSSWYSCIS